MEFIKTFAWTGGSWPSAPSQTSAFEFRVIRALFREQVKTWRDYWGDFPPRDVLRTFYGRARYDAYATRRAHRDIRRII